MLDKRLAVTTAGTVTMDLSAQWVNSYSSADHGEQWIGGRMNVEPFGSSLLSGLLVRCFDHGELQNEAPHCGHMLAGTRAGFFGHLL